MTQNPEFKDLKNSEQNLILKEIEIVNNKIKKFDDYSFIIKGWTITLWTGVTSWSLLNISITFAIYLPIIIVIPFWIFDGLMKHFQRIFTKRSQILENFINAEYQGKFYFYDTTSRLAIEHSGNTKEERKEFKKKYFEKGTFYKCLFVRIVSTVYLILIIFTLIISTALTWNVFGWINISLIGVCIIAICIFWYLSREGKI